MDIGYYLKCFAWPSGFAITLATTPISQSENSPPMSIFPNAHPLLTLGAIMTQPKLIMNLCRCSTKGGVTGQHFLEGLGDTGPRARRPRRPALNSPSDASLFPSKAKKCIARTLLFITRIPVASWRCLTYSCRQAAVMRRWSQFEGSTSFFDPEHTKSIGD
jgi:hypothetical protein